MTSSSYRSLMAVFGAWLLCLFLALPSAYGQDASFQSGVASWYGPWHHGKSTATGEAFDMFAMTAAHRTLPLGTLVKVEHKDSGKSVIVRINDRGPYSKNRIIDLSPQVPLIFAFRAKISNSGHILFAWKTLLL